MLTDCIKCVLAFLAGFNIPEDCMSEVKKGFDRLSNITYGKSFVTLAKQDQYLVLAVEDVIRRAVEIINCDPSVKGYLNRENLALVLYICPIMINSIYNDAKEYSMRRMEEGLRTARYIVSDRKRYIETKYGFVLKADDAYSTPTEGGPQGWMYSNWFVNARCAALDERPFQWVKFINDLGNDPAERFECSVRELWMLASEKAYESEAKEAIMV